MLGVRCSMLIFYLLSSSIQNDLAFMEPVPKSAELFGKNSQVVFMPYGIRFKDERPALNKLNVEH